MFGSKKDILRTNLINKINKAVMGDIRKVYALAVVAALWVCPKHGQGQVLAGTDELGRVLPQYEEVGGPKSDRHVGLFYFLWQGDKASPVSERVWDLNEIQEKTPEVLQDFDHPGWGGGAGRPGRYYFWGESIYGYYRGDDYWVHLKNMQLLADAGVDFLVIDATNRLIYPRQSDALLRAMDNLRKQGKQAPKIVYYTNTASGDAMQAIYDNYYKEDAPYRYPDSWFYLEGKPLIIGISKEATGRDYADFFTIRESQWPNEPEKVNGWPWIEFQRPQKVYRNHKGEREIVNVATAQHPNLEASMGGSAFYEQPGNWGRSFRNGSPGNPSKDLWYGYNIQEQWDFALQQNVPFIFITGWNEWVAGKWRRSSGNKNHALFVDQANPEFSRDIEPTRTAGLRDHYYMQMVSNIRRYKGIDSVQTVATVQTLNGWEDWDAIAPVYKDYVGDVLHRRHPGAQSEPEVMYVNETGRNDMTELKVAVSEGLLHFCVRTVEDITPPSGDNWMTLWLDVDRSVHSGWHGYDFRVVRGNQLQRYLNGTWVDLQPVNGEVLGNQLRIAIPFASLGLLSTGVNLEFKWSDNMQRADPMDWYINGDAAPGGRFNVLVHIR